jgi:hypothetical protein
MYYFWPQRWNCYARIIINHIGEIWCMIYYWLKQWKSRVIHVRLPKHKSNVEYVCVCVCVCVCEWERERGRRRTLKNLTCELVSRWMNIVVEKVLDTLISYSTNSLYQVVTNTLNVVYFYFHIKKWRTSYLIKGLVSGNGRWN